MVNFNSLSEAEKFTFSKDFLVRFKVIKKLKPNLTEEKDILALVARKFYDDDVKGLLDCVQFIDSKTEIKSLDTVDLDEAVDKYQQALAGELSKKRKQHDDQMSLVSQRQMEYNKCVARRNQAVSKSNAAAQKIKNHKIKKALLWTAIIVGGVLIIGGLGGIVPMVNSLLAWVGDLAFHQAAALIALGWGGYKAYKWVMPKLSARSKAKEDKRKAELEKAQEEAGKQNKGLEKAKGDLSASKSELTQIAEALRVDESRVQSEEAKLGRYARLGRFDRSMDLASIAIKEYANKARQRQTETAIIADIEAWRQHFEASLYAGVYMGDIRTQEDMNGIVQEAKSKFEMLMNPLAINSAYTEENIRSRADSRTNRPLEEIFEAI